MDPFGICSLVIAIICSIKNVPSMSAGPTDALVASQKGLQYPMTKSLYTVQIVFSRWNLHLVAQHIDIALASYTISTDSYRNFHWVSTP